MAHLIALPEALVEGATRVFSIGSALNAAAEAAAVPTTNIAAAAADEVSASIAALFGTHGQEFQALSAQAAACNNRFVQALASSAGLYELAEAVNVSPLKSIVQQAFGLFGTDRTGGTGSTGAAHANPNQTTST